MNEKEILLKALHNEPTPRPAWLPFVGVHGAQLLGVSASDYLQSAELLVKGLKRAQELYRPDGLPLIFDLQMEAELLGCKLQWAKDAPPSVASHPLEEGSLASLPPLDLSQGRFPIAKEALRCLKKELNGKVAWYGLLTGPFTLTLHLAGNKLFMSMFDEPERVKQIIAYATGCAKQVADFYLENGADVVAVVDPMTSQISREHFQEFVTPYVNDIFNHIRARGGLSSLFVCGNATRNLEAMCATCADNVSIDENIPLERLRDFTRGRGKSFGGNLKLTSVLLLGDADDARLDAIRCIDVGGCCGFVLAPGCDLPFHTPPANLQAVAEMVQDSYKREICRRTIIAKTAEAGAGQPLPDYAREKEVCVDVITLDSASCAPCKYMMDAVQESGKNSGVPVKIIEHRITTREGLAIMKQLRIENIPTICLDGEAKFVSLIPDGPTLEAAIREKAAAKRK
jgi:uroporphyrinogen decarboxylase